MVERQPRHLFLCAVRVPSWCEMRAVGHGSLAQLETQGMIHSPTAMPRGIR